MGKNPAFQFYTGDWMKDPALRSVSVAARGLWIDLLCLLFESKTKYKMDFSTPVDEPTLISRMTGVSAKQVKRLLAELEQAGVFSRDDRGRIYSRRMKRDEEIRQVRREAGELGGNPILLNQKVNLEDNQSSNQNPTPSSSSSSSTSNNITANQILSFWNESKLPASKDLHSVLKALDGGRPAADLNEAITNYRKILDGDYLLKTKWPLGTFLTKHIEKFLTVNQPEEFYKNRNGRIQSNLSPGEAYEAWDRKSAPLS